MRSRGDYWLDN